MDQYLRLLWLIPLGYLDGSYGTLIRTGGDGFGIPLASREIDLPPAEPST
jgi:hypothetical protein